MIKYQLVLRQENDSIILEENENREVIERMLTWYTNKGKFFVGTFEISERTI